MERRLSAILAADMVGFSRLMEADEAGTIERQKSHRRDLIDPTFRKFDGRIVKEMGDGFLVEFPSVVNAVSCALAIQRAMPEREADVSEDRRIAYRVGINLGDVVVEKDDLLGDGVNVAARLEQLSEPGGIFISGTVYDQIDGRSEFSCSFLGEQKLKNISRPIRTYRVSVAEQAGDLGSSMPPQLPDKPSIAVLPFDNMSGDPEQEYFADGVADDIITALTYWRSFPVTARNSSFAYKNQSVDVKRISRELGARYLLEGSVRKLASRVRVTAQLVDGQTGHHVWAERYERELDDIFLVQDDIVQRIAAIIAPMLTRAEAERSTSKRAKDLDAWDLYLRGMAKLHDKSRTGNAAAIEMFSNALEIRPNYSDAYAGIAMALNQEILFDNVEDRMTTAKQAMDAAQNAIKFDNASSWAHHELSTAYQWLQRFDDALDEARIAVDLNPNDAYALHALGNKSDLAGDPDGIVYMEKAQALNPADARRHTHLTFLARAYVNIGEYVTAVDRARLAIRHDPSYPPAHFILGIALACLGDAKKASAALAECENLQPGFLVSRRAWHPYSNDESNRRFSEALGMIERLD